MGAGTHVGSIPFNRSVGQNLLAVASTYDYEDGYFGDPSIGENVWIIKSPNPKGTSLDFFHKITNGGTYGERKGNVGISVDMYDGTNITWRGESKSGSPAIQISTRKSSHTGGLQSQKIHFEKEK